MIPQKRHQPSKTILMILGFFSLAPPISQGRCRNSTYFLGYTVVQAARLNAGVTGVILQWIVGGWLLERYSN